MKTYFRLAPYQSNIKTEILAGITTFLTAMYIIIVNPLILSDPAIRELFPNSPLTFNALVTATVMVSAISSIAMGMYAHNPILVAPGMGISAFFTYSMILGEKVAPETALGAVFIAGVVFMILSVLKIRVAVIRAIPHSLRYGIAGGIGLFLAFIGMQKSGFIVDHPATLVTLGTLDATVLIFIFGLAITSALVVKKIPGAMIIGISITSLVAAGVGRLWGSGEPLVVMHGIVAWPDFSLFGKLDILAACKLSMIPIIFAIFFTDLFDSLSTFVGVAEAADLMENGEPRNVERALEADAFSTLISGIFGTSSGTSYVESAAGVEQGGRTGLTAVVAGLLFLPFLFLAPLAHMVPAQATAPVLVIVGVFMMKPVMKISWDHFEEALPAFLAFILIPLTYSITQGIVWGFLFYTFMMILRGKIKTLPPMLWCINFFAIIALISR